RRFLNHIMADIDDKVGGLNRAVDEVARRQGRAADKPGVTFVDHALSKLSGKERNAGLLDELAQHPTGHAAVGTCANHQDRRFGLFERMYRSAYRLQDRKSTRLNSSHVKISYADFCLKKKNNRAC